MRITARRSSWWGGLTLPTIVAVALMAAGCGESPLSTTSTPEAPQSAPRFITPETPSGAYLLRLGGTATLQLPPDAPEPTTEGVSVLVVPLAPLTPPGNRQWELRAVEQGDTRITVDLATESHDWTLQVVEM